MQKMCAITGRKINVPYHVTTKARTFVFRKIIPNIKRDLVDEQSPL